jgi:hypothetical protein
MTNLDIWQQLTERHPSWLQPPFVIKLRASGLKALIDQAYEEGQDSGAKRERALSALREISERASEKPSTFEKLFRNFSGS